MARPILPRFEITVLKDKTSSDKSQVPTGATINFYREGATVKTTVTIQPGVPPASVSVHYVGQIETGDTLRVGATSQTLGVLQVVSAEEVLVNLDGPHPYVLDAGTRLWITSNRPNIYSDPLGSVSLGTSIQTDPNNGRASAYLSLDRFDYEVLISGDATRYYTDQSGQMGRSDQRWMDLRDFDGNLQAAVDALSPAGGVAFVPHGVWIVSGGVTISKPID